MADKITELREKREKIVQDQRKLLDRASEEKRGLNTEEQSNYDKLDSEFDSVSTELKDIMNQEDEKRNTELREQKLKDRERELRLSQGRQTALDAEDPNKDKEERDREKENQEKRIADYKVEQRYIETVENFRAMTDNRYSSVEYRDAFRKYIISGINQVPADMRTMLESRALQADNDATGGFLVAPEQLQMSLIQKLDNMIFVRRLANVMTLTNAASMGAPALETDPDDGDWTAEIKTGSEDSSMKFDKRAMTPHPLAKRIKISKTLLRTSAMPVENIVTTRISYKMAVPQEQNFLTGDGQNKPLGVFTASAMGINTDRDVSAGNNATSIGADGLREAKYALKKQYRMLPSLRWAFSRTAVKQISKLKTGDGDYIWRQGITQSDPDTILGIPYEESEYVPSTFTTGQYVGILGAWEYYWIVDALNMQIQVLTELYAETNQNGYIARYEGDGMPVLSEAWVRVKLG
jgi:HK97 family phage major capsid protein